MKKYFIGLVIIILVLIALWFFYGKNNLGALVAGNQYLYNGQASNVVSISYDGATDEIILEGGNTAATLGLTGGDRVNFFTASAAFGGSDAPSFTEATVYYIKTSLSYTTVEISTTPTGGALDIAAAASAGGSEFLEELIDPRAIDVSDAGKLIFTFCGDATASMAFSFVGSENATQPDFRGLKTSANPFDTIAVFDLQNNTESEGDSAISINASADCRQFETYGSGYRWVSALPTIFGAGAVDLQVQKVK